MPLHNYKCTECNLIFEHLWFFGDSTDGYQPSNTECEACGATANACGGELFARTVGRWGDSLSYYDRGLGCTVKSPAHRDRLMAEKGVKPVCNKDPHINCSVDENGIITTPLQPMFEVTKPVSQEALDDHQHRKITEHAQHEKQMSAFKEYSKTMDVPDAIDKTFNLDHSTKLNTEI